MRAPHTLCAALAGVILASSVSLAMATSENRSTQGRLDAMSDKGKPLGFCP